MPYAQEQRVSPWLAGGAGFAAGVGADMVARDIKAAKSRANWGLGLGIGIAGLTLVNSGNLTSQSQNAVNIANAMNALAFTAGGTLGAESGALRAQCVNLASTTAQGLFFANPWNFFSTQPPQVSGVSTAAASTGTTTATVASNNNGLALVLLVGVAALAIAAN